MLPTSVGMATARSSMLRSVNEPEVIYVQELEKAVIWEITKTK
jgi:hypothetical protein